MEALASRERTLCLQGQFGRAAKTLSSEGIAPDNRKTLIELEKLHPGENKTLEPMEDYSCEAFHFDEAKVLLQLHSFSNFTAAGPSKCTPSIFSTKSIIQFPINPSNEFPNRMSENGQQRPAPKLRCYSFS